MPAQRTDRLVETRRSAARCREKERRMRPCARRGHRQRSLRHHRQPEAHGTMDRRWRAGSGSLPEAERSFREVTGATQDARWATGLAHAGMPNTWTSIARLPEARRGPQAVRFRAASRRGEALIGALASQRRPERSRHSSPTATRGAAYDTYRDDPTRRPLRRSLMDLHPGISGRRTQPRPGSSDAAGVEDVLRRNPEHIGANTHSATEGRRARAGAAQRAALGAWPQSAIVHMPAHTFARWATLQRGGEQQPRRGGGPRLFRRRGEVDALRALLRHTWTS